MLTRSTARLHSKLWLTLLACVAPTLAAPAQALAESQGRETQGRTSWWLPENIFPSAQPIDQLFYFILYLTVVVCIAVFAVMIFFLVKYRYKPGRRATYTHGNTRLEIVWTIIPTVIMALIAAVSQATWSNLKTPPPVSPDDPPINVEVIARQFKWYTRYPGADGKFGPRRTDRIDPASSDTDELIGLDRSHPDAKDDIVSPVMYIPVNKRVHIRLVSVDVIHSFFVPNFRIKQDALPGLAGQVWIQATKTSAQVIGTNPDGSPKPFDIVCAELCGQGHYTMRGLLYVVNQDQYDAFLQEEATYLDLDEGEQDEYY